ncbi:transglutaminase [Aquimarina sp. I32.4]|uniref:transglutaminase n=1 Tax=Aquimarina sp. I32.4 TaxID=2053903 RepID=UPI000CDE5A91|nr:transglutaminase [Aquimarina sp. I32.4]
MKTIKILIVSVFFVFSTISYAQEYKFGKVSKEELLETIYTEDSSANAVVLYENKRVSFEYNSVDGFEVITEVFKRVKLYNKEGYENATEKIYLYKNRSGKEKVTGVKGITHSIVNGKLVTTKLKKEGVFEEEFSEYKNVTKFTMPSLQEGSVVEYKYRITSPFYFYIDRVYLQYDIPIKKISVKVEAPEYFNFKKRTVGYLPIKIKESKRNSKINFVNKQREGGYNLRTGPAKTSYSNSTLDYVINVNSVDNTHVPAFKKEPYAGNFSNYISSIVYELEYTKFPNGAIKNYSTTWGDVTKEIYQSTKFGDELKREGYFKEDLDKLIKGVVNPVERAALVYGFVKKKMAWNGKANVYTDKGVKKAYKDGTGNAAEINIMLTAMLNYAKLEANPVLVSTSDRLISLFPTLDGFNYVITRVKFPDGKILYLDGTDPYGFPNVLPNRVIQGMARVIAKNGTSQSLNLRPKKNSINQYSINYEIDDKGSVNGKLNMRHTHYLAHEFRTNHGGKDIETNKKRIQDKYDISEVENYHLKGTDKLGKGVSESFEFSLDDQVEMIEGEMFFAPMLFLKSKINVFKSEDRKYPVDFAFGYSNSYILNIKIPEGYEVVESLKSERIKMPEGLGEFYFMSSVTNNTIQIKVTEKINRALISVEYYPTLKEFYSKLVEKENEHLVLKKI